MTKASIAARGTTSTIQRQSGAGFRLCSIQGPRVRELHLTLTPRPGERAAAFSQRLHRLVREAEARIVQQEVFGPVALREELLAALRQQFGPLTWPVTWTEGADCAGHPLAGTHVTAIAGVEPQPVEYRGRIVGCTCRDDAALHYWMGGLGPNDPAASKAIQAAQTFENLQASLAQVKMTMAHVARTWFFLDDILGWYDDFNRVRTDFFKSQKVFDGLVPASTGVGTRNPGGAAVAAAARALRAVDGSDSVREVASPKQCAATCYGSSFSRAVEIATPAGRHVIVSGTASIEPGGKSVCGGDVDGQIDLTLQVVRAILVARGTDFADATRVTAYLPNPADAPLLAKWIAKYGLKHWPVVITQATICRDDLLFEIELDTVTTATPPPVPPARPRPVHKSRAA